MRASPVLVVAFCLTAVLAPTAEASSGGREAIIQVGQPPRMHTALDSVPHPWPGTALALSAIGTALPVVIASRPHPHENNSAYSFGLMGAEIVTPAAGHVYAGLYRRGAVGMATRAVGFAIAAAGGYGSSGSSDFTGGDLAVLFGATMVGVSALWDVVTVPGDVEQRNRAWLEEHASLELRPLPDGRAPAFAMTVRF